MRLFNSNACRTADVNGSSILMVIVEEAKVKARLVLVARVARTRDAAMT